jgi:serine/threonine protein kinase
VNPTEVLAATPTELLGDPPAKGDADALLRVKRKYRRLLIAVHPDQNPGDPKAAPALERVNQLWEAYSHSKPVAKVTITTRKRTYTLGAVKHKGDLSNLYAATAPGPGDVLVKMPRNPRSNDLMEAEGKALKRIADDGDDKYAPYVPQLVETFKHRDTATGVDRRVNVFPDDLKGFVSLAEVAKAYPDGLQPKDAAWMWRRLLVAAGYAHSAGVVHGAIVPDHVLIHPDVHGLVLVDWCYSVLMEKATPTAHLSPFAPKAATLTALVPQYRDLYPPAVGHFPASPATDIYMLTKTMLRLIGKRIPSPMYSFAVGCTDITPPDAWSLLAEYDDLLERLYGPRTFRPFHMPAPTN